MQFLFDAHQRHPHRLGLGEFQPPEQFRPAERPERALQTPDHFIHVRKRHHEGDGFAIKLGDPDQGLVDDRLQTFAGMVDLVIGHRHKAPVGRPGIVQQAHDDCGVAVKMILVDLADHQFLVALS